MLSQEDLIQYLEIPEEDWERIEARIQVIASNLYTSPDTILSYALKLIRDHIESHTKSSKNIKDLTRVEVILVEPKSGTNLEQELSIKHVLMTNKLSQQKEERLLKWTNWIAIWSLLEDTLNYAVQEIERETKNCQIADDGMSIASAASTRSMLLGVAKEVQLMTFWKYHCISCWWCATSFLPSLLRTN